MNKIELNESQKIKIAKCQKQVGSLGRTQDFVIFISLLVFFLSIYFYKHVNGTEQKIWLAAFLVHNVLFINANVSIMKQKTNLKVKIQNIVSGKDDEEESINDN